MKKKVKHSTLFGGAMVHIRIDSINNEFVVEKLGNKYPEESLRFMGTINGAINLNVWLLENRIGDITTNLRESPRL